MSSLKLIYVGLDQCRQILAMADISGGFWLFAMAKFLKDGSTTAPYSDMAAPHVGQYGRILALRRLP